MGEPKFEELLDYVQSELAGVRVRLWGSPDDEQVLPLIRFDIPGIGSRYLGITRELWDHTEDFDALRHCLERHQWREAVLSPASEKYLTLGETGWRPLEWGTAPIAP